MEAVPAQLAATGGGGKLQCKRCWKSLHCSLLPLEGVLICSGHRKGSRDCTACYNWWQWLAAVGARLEDLTVQLNATGGTDELLSTTVQEAMPVQLAATKGSGELQ